jgi:hypothetical protein
MGFYESGFSSSSGVGAASISDNVVAMVSGTTFSGDISAPGITGSLTKTLSGKSAFVAGSGIAISSASSDQVIVSFTNAAGVAASSTAQYLVLSTNALLTNERTLIISGGLKAVDAGANSTYTVSPDNNVLATISGSNFTGPVTASAGIFAQGLQLTASAAPSNAAVVKGWTAITITGSTYFMPLYQ